MSMPDWPEASLDSICELITDGSHYSPKTLPSGYPYVTVRNIGRTGIDFDNCESVDEKAFLELKQAGCSPRTGDVLYSKDGTVGKVAVNDTDREFVVLSSLAILRPNAHLVSSAFLGLALSSEQFLRAATQEKTGLAIKRVVLKNLRRLTVPLPPQVEQRRIVDLIGGLDAQIEALNAERRALETYWESNVNDIDGERVLLGSLLERIDAGKSPLAEERQPGPGERAVLKVSAVERGRFNPLAVKTVHPSVRLPDALTVRRGDVLLVRANGVLSRVGQVCQVRIDPTSLFLCDKTLRLVTSPDMLLSDYLCHILSSTRSRQQIEALTGGSHMRNISQQAIRQIEIPLLDLGQQAEIAGTLTACLDLSDALGAEGDSAVRLRERLLARLLSGKVEIAESYDEHLSEAV
jgi:type I restriction enzyme S subunit